MATVGEDESPLTWIAILELSFLKCSCNNIPSKICSSPTSILKGKYCY